MKREGVTKEWRVEPRPIHGYQVIDSDGTEILADVYRKEDAELIITAVNERERLREALRLARGFASEATWGPRSAHSRKAEWLVKQIDAALNEVEG